MRVNELKAVFRNSLQVAMFQLVRFVTLAQKKLSA